MKFLCWLIDHDWKHSIPLRCARCRAEPYDDLTLPEWWLNVWRFRLAPIAKRVRVWFRSRPCWIKDHEWSPVAEHCLRCKQTGIDVAEQGEWTLPQWKKLWRPWLTDRFYIVKPYIQEQSIYAIQVFAWRFGLERSTIYIRGAKYMTRYIAYLGPIGLRLHQFFRGDDDRASHTHPWPFITFPFTSYVEQVYLEGAFVEERLVRAFRFHYRPADFEHIVKGPAWTNDGMTYKGVLLYSNVDPPLFWTFVITGPKTDDWGFYPKPGKFVYWRDYK
jgi:hypothetical protein